VQADDPKPASRGARLRSFFNQELWRSEWTDVAALPALGLHVLRLFTIAARGLVVHRCGFRAAGLTYYTVLSMVPFLAFIFAVAKGFGAYDRLVEQVVRPFVKSTFGATSEEEGAAAVEALRAAAELTGAAAADVVVEQGANLRDAIDQVLAFVEGTEVSSLGAFGLAVLLFTVVKLLSHVEGALNDVWGVRRARSIPRKLADYTAMVVVSVALAVGAGPPILLRSNLGLGMAGDLALRALPILAVWVVFTLLFLVLPNTRVRLRSAVVGGLCSALLWTLAQRVYVQSTIGVASYNELYASFAAIPLFLVWIWLSWIVVLLGAEFAYADQNHHAYGRRRLAGAATPAEVEVLGMRALVRVTDRFMASGAPWTTEALVFELHSPEERLREALGRLADAGLIARTENAEEEGWVCGRDPQKVRLLDARRALRGSDSALRTLADESIGEVDARLRRALGGLDLAASSLTENSSMGEIVAGDDRPADE